jgi:enoyl-CoA hydratase/carnithine racemase
MTDVGVERDGAALIIRLNRPEARNAIRTRTWQELEVALDTAESDGAVRVVVLTGGPDWFAAGADLRENASSDPAVVADAFTMTMRLRLAQRVLERLHCFPKPTVAAVEGYAIGLGWCLALSCDLIVASDSAFFAQPAATAGMLADGGLIRQLCDALGVRRTTEILFTRTKLPADEAHRYGMVTRLTKPGHTLEGAQELVTEIAQRPASVHFINKALLASAQAGGEAGYLEHEATAVALNRMQPANIEGRQQFLAGQRFYGE